MPSEAPRLIHGSSLPGKRRRHKDLPQHGRAPAFCRTMRTPFVKEHSARTSGLHGICRAQRRSGLAKGGTFPSQSTAEAGKSTPLLKSLPLTRRPGAGRDGVGLRERGRRTRSHGKGGPNAEGKTRPPPPFPAQWRPPVRLMPCGNALCPCPACPAEWPFDRADTADRQHAFRGRSTPKQPRIEGKLLPPLLVRPCLLRGSGEIISPRKALSSPSSVPAGYGALPRPPFRSRSGKKFFRFLHERNGKAPVSH